MIGKKAVIDHKPFHVADLMETWADIEKAKDLLGWDPKVSLDEGLDKSVSWYMENREWLKYKSLSSVPQIALVGCGYWGKNLCRNFHALGALAAVVDATENGQATARTLAPDAQITNSLDEVLRNDQIQGIALATPAETHAELAIQSLHSGKDVFVEKPMALTLEDAEKMKKVANGNLSNTHGWTSPGIPPCGSQTSRNDCVGTVG